MKTETFPTDLQLGTSNRFWVFSTFTNTIRLFDVSNSAEAVEVHLNADQVDRIMRMNDGASISLIDAELANRPVRLHLAGKQTGIAQWAGVAAILPESKYVEQDFVETLAFDDQIVSHVNAVVVVLDHDMRI